MTRRRPRPSMHLLALTAEVAALVLATPATAQTPVAAAVATMSTCNPRGQGILIGSTYYAAPALAPVSGLTAVGGYQVLVLSRSSLQLISNQTFPTNFPSNSKLSCQQQHTVLAPYLQGLTSTSLVIVTSIGSPGYLQPKPAGPCSSSSTNLGAQIQALGGSSGVVTAATSYALIGIPGLGEANGWQDSNALTTTGTGSLTGYLVPDVHDNYTFLWSLYATITTRATSQGNPGVQVGSAFYAAPLLGAGAQGGYQAVVLASQSSQALALVTNQTFSTNFGTNTSMACSGQEQMVKTLSAMVAKAPSTPVVMILSSILDPGAVLDEHDCKDLKTTVADLVQSMQGTGAALGSGVNYSLVSPLNSTAPPEASSAFAPNSQAQLRRRT